MGSIVTAIGDLLTGVGHGLSTGLSGLVNGMLPGQELTAMQNGTLDAMTQNLSVLWLGVGTVMVPVFDVSDGIGPIVTALGGYLADTTTILYTIINLF